MLPSVSWAGHVSSFRDRQEGVLCIRKPGGLRALRGSESKVKVKGEHERRGEGSVHSRAATRAPSQGG